jgi:TolB protein
MAPDPLVIAVQGRLERSATVVLEAYFEGRQLADSEVVWTASPAGAAAFLPGQQAVFFVAGPITLTAASAFGMGTYDAEVRVPPMIVFQLLRDGNRDIYRAALDGGDTLRLTTSPAEDGDPTLAGDSVVFVSYRDGNAELYATSLNGGVPRRLTTTAVAEAAPALSSNGSRLAYTRSDAGVPKLWISASDGSNAARVTESFGFGGSIEASPTWAPAGDRVAFVSTADGTADIFFYTLGTAAFAPLVPDAQSSADVEPAWSSDGTRIAFASDRAGDTEIYVLEISTGTVTRLTTRAGPDGQPTWTNDGRLVYTAWSNGIPELRWMDPDAPADVTTIGVGPGVPGHPSGGN